MTVVKGPWAQRGRSTQAWWLLWMISLCGTILPPAAAEAEDLYEWARTRALLERGGLTLDTSPEGKRIAYIRIVRDDVFVKDELWPIWFNWFHRLSRDRVVRRELLFEADLPYRDARVEETMRNLRSMGIFSLVRIVAVRSEWPDAVGVVVHTRDLWSLRLEQEANITRQINLLRLLLVERNLLGLNKDLGAEVQITPDRLRLAQSYVARRMLGSNVRLAQSAHVYHGRFSPGIEGGGAFVSIAQPYYRLAQRLSWTLEGSYGSGITRQLDGNADYALYGEEGNAARVVYRQRNSYATGEVAYRFGDEVKIAVGGGLTFQDNRANAVDETQLPGNLREDFKRDVLPLERRDMGPHLFYDMFLARFRTLTNLGTFGQSENVRIGPRVTLQLYSPVEAWGASGNALVLSGTASVTHTRGRGFFLGSFSATTRLQNGRQIDQRALAQLRLASPTLGPVRLVTRLALDARRRDTRRTPVSLGSDRGLRGYEARTLNDRGASRLLGNFEVRTVALRLRSLHVGGVLFYDVGSIYTRLKNIQLNHAVGVGLRFFFPQFNRYPFSFDLGVATEAPFTLESFVPALNTAQSVPMTSVETDSFP